MTAFGNQWIKQKYNFDVVLCFLVHGFTFITINRGLSTITNKKFLLCSGNYRNEYVSKDEKCALFFFVSMRGDGLTPKTIIQIQLTNWFEANV